MLKKSSYLNSFYREFSLIFFSISISIFTFYSYQYIIRLLPNSIKPNLESIYQIGNSQFGSFAGIYYLGYIVIHIPLGVMISRLGAKIIVPASLALTGLGLLPIILNWHWNLVIYGRFISGIGSSCAAVAGFQIFRQISPDKYARMVGYMMFFGLCTAKFSEEYLSFLFQKFSLDYILTLLLLFALILSCILFWVIPKFETKRDKNIILDIKEIIANKKLIFLSFCAALMVGSLEGFSDAWGSELLMQIYPNMNKITADHNMSFIFIGMSIGTLILPYISDRYNLSYFIALISCLGMAFPFLLMMFGVFPQEYIYYPLAIIGFFCAYQASTIAMIAKHAPANKAGLTATFINMIMMSFGNIFHKSIAFITELLINRGISKENAHIAGISVVPLAALLAFILLIFFQILTKKNLTKYNNSF
ncbi:MAG: MFS transporter [Rickettsia sp.]|nr:MFS transporter [Rickettsia sp.]